MDTQLSKSGKKRRAKEIEQLIHELAALPRSEIDILPCDQEIRDEINAARALKGGAKKRQLKYATKLLRNKPVEELYDFLARKKGSMLKTKREFHELEHFRNLLLEEAIQLYEAKTVSNGFLNEKEPGNFLQDCKTVQDIVNHLPDIDRDQLENTAIQFARTRNRKFSRELFRIMQAALQKAQFSSGKDTNHGI